MGQQTNAGLISTLPMSDMVDLVNRNFVAIQAMPALRARELYINDSVGEHQGSSKLYEEYDVETFALAKPESNDMQKTKPGLGYQKIATAKRVGRQIDITWEMRRYAKEPQVISAFTNLGHFAPQRLEVDLTHRFTYATASTYTDMDGNVVDITCGDGLPLLSSAHLLAFSISTYRNRVVNDPLIGQGSYESALDLLANQSLTNFGEIRTIEPNYLAIHNNPVSKRITRQILGSMADITAVQAGVENVYKNGGNGGVTEVIVLPYLATLASGKPDSTKKDIWFVGAFNKRESGWQSYLAIFEEPTLWTPAKGNNGENFSNQNWSFGVTMSYAIVVLSGRGLVGSYPTSVATY
jgi:hypothetical protein